MTDGTKILITGFPGSFLASRVLQNVLAKDPTSRVTCLVHGKFLGKAGHAIKALSPEHMSRVEILEGDAASMDLGLSGKEFMALAETVNVIHHCAAVTYLGVDRKTADAVNIGATQEVIELARTAKNLKQLVHWSTALVSGTRKGFVLESELESGQGFHNIIEETRFRAERAVRAISEKLPTTIIRPGIIVGDALTGEIDRFDGPYLLIQLLLNAPSDMRLPLLGRGNIPLNFVPINYVADAGCAIARDPKSIGKTFHIVDPRPLNAKRVFELISTEAGRPLPRLTLPTQLATALMRTPGLDKFSHVPRAFLEQLQTEVAYDARNTEELLRGHEITCPSFDTYVSLMVKSVREKLLADKASAKKSFEAAQEDPLA